VTMSRPRCRSDRLLRRARSSRDRSIPSGGNTVLSPVRSALLFPWCVLLERKLPLLGSEHASEPRFLLHAAGSWP